MDSLRLRSFKLRFTERHVRVVPAVGVDGCPFGGPGVDLFASDADAVFASAGPLLRMLASLEPGITVRSLSLDLERPRLLATLEPASGERPRVVRVDAGALLEQVLEQAEPLVVTLSAPVLRTLKARY